MGINTPDPKATLDIAAKTLNSSIPDTVIIYLD